MTKREQTLVAVAIVAVMLGVAYWYFFYSPKSAQLSALEARVDSLQAANQQARADIARGSVDSLRGALGRDRQALRVMTRLVPTSNEVPALLEDVSTAARRVGLDLASVEPMPVIAGDEFDTYRYKISVIGGYHELGTFLGNVGALERIVAPVALEMKPYVPANRPNTRGPAAKPKLDSNFQIQTYVARTRIGDDVTASASDDRAAVTP